MRGLLVAIGAYWTGYGHRLQGFLDSEYLAVERLTICAYPFVVSVRHIFYRMVTQDLVEPK